MDVQVLQHNYYVTSAIFKSFMKQNIMF